MANPCPDTVHDALFENFRFLQIWWWGWMCQQQFGVVGKWGYNFDRTATFGIITTRNGSVTSEHEDRISEQVGLWPLQKFLMTYDQWKKNGCENRRMCAPICSCWKLALQLQFEWLLYYLNHTAKVYHKKNINMGLSENSVPLNPLDYHHCPQTNAIWGYTMVYLIFRHSHINICQSPSPQDIFLNPNSGVSSSGCQNQNLGAPVCPILYLTLLVRADPGLMNPQLLIGWLHCHFHWRLSEVKPLWPSGRLHQTIAIIA